MLLNWHLELGGKYGQHLAIYIFLSKEHCMFHVPCIFVGNNMASLARKMCTCDMHKHDSCSCGAHARIIRDKQQMYELSKRERKYYNKRTTCEHLALHTECQIRYVAFEEDSKKKSQVYMKQTIRCGLTLC
jgi:hypothetical protein